MKTRPAVLALCAVALGVSLAARAQNPPPTPPPAVPPPGIQIGIGGRGVPGGIPVQPGRGSLPPAPLVTTGLIVGRVIDPATGRGVSSAIVTLNGGPTRISTPSQPGPPVPVGPPPPPPQILTDSDGRFAFLSLTRGNYSLAATKSGYAAGAYGRMRPNGATRPVQLDDGEKMGDVTIRIFKYGSISGMVIDDAGEPVVQTEVRAYRRTPVSGRRVLQPTGGVALTDDRGLYRLGNLVPGEYVILAPIIPVTAPNAAPVAGNRPNMQGTMQMLTSGVSPSPGSGGQVIGGDSRFVLQRNTGMAGDVSATTDASGRVLGFGTVYYPNSATASGAQSIAVASGEEKTGVDIAMRRGPTVSISGTLTGLDSPAAGFAIRLIPVDTGDIAQEPEAAVGMTDGSGSFMFLGVSAGQYVIQTMRLPRAAPPSEIVRATPQAAAALPMPLPTVEPLLWAMAPVSVGDTDVRGIVLTLREGLTVSGRFEFSGSRPKPEGPRMSQIPINVEPADGRQQQLNSGPPSRSLPDGRFTSTGQLPGKYFIRVGGPPGGWYLQSITANGVDVTEAPIELSTASISNVVVTFTDVTQDVRGNVTGVPAGADAPMVVIFPSDSNGWKNYGFNPTRIKTTRAGQAGAFAIGALPPGDYFAVAIPDEYSSEWQDALYLEALTRSAARFTLAPGERKTVDVALTDVKPPAIGRPPLPAAIPTPAIQETPEDTAREHGPFEIPAPQQVRDTRPAPAVGGGSIAGVVRIDNGSVVPARYARVSVRMSTLPGERTTLTDDEGRYSIGGLPPGSYQVYVTKPAYLAMYYGARRPAVAQGTPVQVDAGKPVTGIDVTLHKGGVVTGIIIGADGEPAAGIRVQLLQRLLTDGETRLSGAASTGSLVTDDRGMFRMFGIRPGSYALSAVPTTTSNSASEVRQLSDQEIQTAIMEAKAAKSRMAASTGASTRVLAPASGPLPTPPPAGRPVGFAPVYYPGTTLEDQAGIFTVSAGQEVRVSISLQLVSTARLEGTIATADGQPAPMQNLQLTLQRAVPSATPVSQVRMTEPGRFQAVGVPPGRYLLTARVNSQEGRPNGPPGTPQLPPGQWFAQQEIEVTGVDLAGIALTLGPPLSVSGKVVFEGGAPPPDAQIQVRLDSAGRVPVGSYSRALKPADNGEFTIPGVTPGRYRLNASVINANPGQPITPTPAPNAPPPWAVKSAIIDGRDALESPFELQMGRAPQGAVVTLTNRLPQLSASIVDQAGKPVPNMIFVLFSANRENWTGTTSRRIRTIVRPNDDGIYQFNSLLPGEYLLAVLTEIEPNDQFDPNFLEQLVPDAIKVTLAEGDRKTQQLRMAR